MPFGWREPDAKHRAYSMVDGQLTLGVEIVYSIVDSTSGRRFVCWLDRQWMSSEASAMGIDIGNVGSSIGG